MSFRRWDVIQKLWDVIQDPDKRAVISWIGGGIVVAAGGFAGRRARTLTPAPIESRAVRLFRDVAVGLFLLLPGFAVAGNADPQAQTAQSTDDDEDDPTHPVQSFDLRYRFRDGSVTKQNDRRYLILRTNSKIDLDEQWRLGLRADLPMVASNAIGATNPEGVYVPGVGDPLVQASLTHTIGEGWALAFGGQVIAPAVSGAAFGGAKWLIVPGAAVRYLLPEFGADSYFVPQVRYATSFAGDPSARHISNLQFGPQLRISMPDHWFVTLYPSTDIRINYGDPVSGQTGKLFLPFDFMIGRNLTKDVVVSLEVSVPIVKDYPVYLLKAEARLGITF